MSAPDPSTETADTLGLPRRVRARTVVGLAVAWSLEEPERLGEFLPVTRDVVIVGRGSGDGEGGHRGRFYRMRPGRNEPTGPLRARRISREQLRITRGDGTLQVENIGRAPLVVDGREVDAVSLRPGDVVELRNALVLFCLRRPEVFPPLPAGLAYPPPPFGEPDTFGIVGESQQAWDLREQIAFVAERPTHVIVRGPSGAGKELAARALHTFAHGSLDGFVARNAATIPASLLDAELFGNAKNYPNPGMKERRGLIGEADGGTLFLDEIGEIEEAAQAHLLRALDAGEYQRLGEATTRRSDFRLIAATNRPLARLKDDFRARFKMEIVLPDLNERREDVPLILRALLRGIARDDPSVHARFFTDGEPRVAPDLVTAALKKVWTNNVRELEALAWSGMQHSRGEYIESPPAAPPRIPEAAPRDPEPEEISAALSRHDWVVAHSWRELGLRNRYQLARLMKKHGIERPD